MLPLLGALAGGALAPTLGIGALTASAVGSGLGSYLQTGNLQQGIASGITAYFGGKMLGAGTESALAPSEQELLKQQQLRGMATPQAGAPRITSPNIAADMRTASGPVQTMSGRSAVNPIDVAPVMAPPAPTPISQPVAFGMDAKTLGQVAGAGLGGMAAIPPKVPQMGGGYQGDYANAKPFNIFQPATRGYARSGNTVKGFQAGGIASLSQVGQLNDKELISATIEAITNRVPEAETIIAMFIQRFGKDKLIQLIESVLSGRMADTAGRSEGVIRGTGDGMDDMNPATIEGEQDVLLAENEYIVPSDVVSGLGNGSTDAGGRVLDDMVEDVRMARTGTAKQPRAIDAAQLMPV